MIIPGTRYCMHSGRSTDEYRATAALGTYFVYIGFDPFDGHSD